MNQSDAIQKLKEQRAAVGPVRELAHGEKTNATVFQAWYRKTDRLLERIFGEGSKESQSFRNLNYSLRAFSTETPKHRFVQAFARGCDSAAVLLDTLIEEVEEYGLPGGGGPPTATPSTEDRLSILFDRFHTIAVSLRKRRSTRPPLTMDDEYDVQYLLLALLLLDFEDVRPEENTPSSAGGSSRLDFLLKREETVVEVKMTRKSMTDADLREELGADITHYAAHPDCKALYCFVYDPDHRISQPKAFEADLSVPRNGMPVKVVIRPRR